MAEAKYLTALSTLRDSSSSIQDHISALKQIKHDIIGHDQRKEEVVHAGLIPVLVDGLRAITSSTESRKREPQESHIRDGHATSEGAAFSFKEGSWQHEDEFRLQCYFVIASIARAGPAFVAPLVAGGVLPPLLSTLTATTIPSRLITEALRTTNIIAEALASTIRVGGSSHEATLQKQLYTTTVLDDLATIVAQPCTSSAEAEQLCLVTKLLGTTLKESQHKDAVVRAGLLDTLASKLAEYMSDIVQDSLDEAGSRHMSRLPQYALAPLLIALAQTINGSLYRTARLLYARSVNTPLGTSYSMDQFQHTNQPMMYDDTNEFFLPKLQAVESRTEHGISKNFPALGSFAARSGGDALAFVNSGLVATSRLISLSDFGSPILAWLIHLARVREGSERLAALWLLINMIRMTIHSHIDGFRDHGNRDRTLAILIVPLIVKMIEESLLKAHKSDPHVESAYQRDLREKAPKALAKLITDQKELQRAAVDAGVIKLLSQLLKKTFDAAGVVAKKPMWSSANSSTSQTNVTGNTDATRLESNILTPEQTQQFKCRAAALEALAAVAQKEDANRKLVIESGVMQCIVDSLVPITIGNDGSPSAGNPPSVVAKACDLVTALSRSVAMLRTCLVDGGVAKPIFGLLTNSSITIQIAATKTTSNLVLHFSQMRQSIDSGIIDTLAEHAHSSNKDLAYNSLWALKHLVNSPSDADKMRAFEKVNPAWILQACKGRHSSETQQMDTALTVSQEPIDTIRSEDYASMAADEEMTEEGRNDDDELMIDTNERYRPVNHGLSATEIAARLRAIKQAESNETKRAEMITTRIQIQALDFVRNLISEPVPSQYDMVDHLISAIGKEQLFEMLERNFRPTATKDKSLPGQQRINITDYAPSDVIISTLFILIHIANGRTSHRDVLISQTSLLATIVPLFAHPDTRIRVGCCWLIHNLTWQQDGDDATDNRARVNGLRALGIEEAIRRLAKEPDGDVRERAKQVLDVFSRFASSSGNEGNDNGRSDGGVATGISGGPRAWDR